MKLLVCGLLFASYLSLGQNLQIKTLHYRNYFQFDSTSQERHTAVKPYIGTEKKINKSSLSLPIPNQGYFYPLLDLGAGVDTRSKEIISAGVGLGLEINRPKITLSGRVLPYYQRGGFVRDSIQRRSSIDLGTGRSIANNTFIQGELVAAFRPNKFFTFMGGFGKNSFGEGYRSLLLSDNAASNPFIKLETNFWSIKYVSLFNLWQDFYANPTDRKNSIDKLSAVHYLSWNISKSFNLSIFETVIWQAKDSLTNRYFEPNYLNPFVLYRPVEFSQGSADNVLLGLNLSYKPNNNSTWYAQLILDEFLLAEIRAREQWWANKFGTQIGVKSTQFLIPHLFGQVEFNLVRPFTYSHQQSPQNYGHSNASVAHPIGANFYEVNGILSYQHKKHQITTQFVYTMFGTDTASVSYGQNIFASYTDRDGEYNHTIGQGVQQNIFSANFYYDYPVKYFPNCYVTARYQMRLATSEKHFSQNHSFEIGIRSRIWNRNDDI